MDTVISHRGADATTRTAGPLQPVQGKLAWTTEQAPDKEAFCWQLAAPHLSELDAYLAKVRDRSLDDVTREDLQGPRLQKFLGEMRQELQQGLGMVIIQGCTLERYSRQDFEHIFWAMGLTIGQPISQSVFGERIAHVRQEPHNPSGRTYRTTKELIHHTDTPDALGLMCVRTAKSGGLSTAVSALAVYNEIVRTRPELMPALLRGAPYHRFGQELPGQQPISEYNVPVFSICDGFVSCMYVRHMMITAAAKSGIAIPPDLQQAMDCFDELAADPRFAIRFSFASGDIMFVNNRTMLHARTEYEDFDDPEYKRDLLRLWLDLPHGQRPVVPETDPYQQPASGGRGGVAHQPEKAAA